MQFDGVGNFRLLGFYGEEDDVLTWRLLQMEQDGGKHQNGWIHSCSQRSVEEHLQETTIGDGGTHLVEFSNAMRGIT